MLTIEFPKKTTRGLTNQRPRSVFLDIGHVLAGTPIGLSTHLYDCAVGMTSTLPWRRYYLDVDISSDVDSCFHVCSDVDIHLVCEFTWLLNHTVSGRRVICYCWDGVVLLVCELF